jgi:hypothetical protein
LIADAPIDGYKQNGKGQGTSGLAKDRHKDYLIKESMDTDHTIFPRETDGSEQDTEYTTQYIHEQWVHTKSFEKQTPFLLSLDIDYPNE